MKPLQNYIEEEVEKFKKIRIDAISEMFNNVDEYGIYPTTKFFNSIDDALSQSLHRIAKITAEEIEKNIEKERWVNHKLSDNFGLTIEQSNKVNDLCLKSHNNLIDDIKLIIQTKIKEFGI